MKLNKIWGYGQLFGYSAYEGKNHYEHDHILMLMDEDLNFRYEFLKHYVNLSFKTKEKINYKAVMSDFVTANIKNKPFILTFLDSDTLIGLSPIEPSFKGEIALTKLSNKPLIYHIDEHYLAYLSKKVGKQYKFIIRHYINKNDIRKDLTKLLNNTNIESLVKRYVNYYKKMPTCQDKKYEELYYKSLSVNKVNTHTQEGKIKYFWTTPDRVPHRHMWLWDTGFHALMMKEFNIKKAE